ncbi:acyl-CoA thioesterase [Psychrosphaera sp. B3R10]|uniref:acyl-CoA thioesterase n=1 Tax=unclassified Psychrosphaera TaxID=2641570 RepID=UPI001C089D3D|nr:MULTISPECIES: acyl-CoA thioesterase [unclassified Psychrosphaera]MBU2881271.1 acyl-CoA thioesterase [Psychrosphaera sp. I2R16]MBU2988370.1 acyl-CoA thioesterase [Psychrosphaera sp. B3R10]MDO6720130.1 acyl-CoA thioesterase [Psychrosphaera sp. 1_MG-2023]
MEVSEKVQARINYATTFTTKTVFPGRTNHHNTLFGGEALAWMDEVAFICATRFCRKPLVTISSDRVDFKEPIPAGSIVELVASIANIGRTSLVVEVNVLIEKMYEDEKHRAISGSFKFVALDDDRKPTPVLGGVEL